MLDDLAYARAGLPDSETLEASSVYMWTNSCERPPEPGGGGGIVASWTAGTSGLWSTVVVTSVIRMAVLWLVGISGGHDT